MRHQTTTTMLGVTTAIALCIAAAAVWAGTSSAGSSLAAAQPAEFIEVDMLMIVHPGTGSGEETDCRSPESGVVVCDYTGSGETSLTLLGRTTHNSRGVRTHHLNESCSLPGGETGFVSETDGEGQFTTQPGDALFYRIRGQACRGTDVSENVGYLSFIGGTGRFQDATGSINRVSTTEPGSYGVGTLQVRADLWADVLADTAARVTPGTASAAEGDNGTVIVEVPVHLSKATAEPVTVEWATLDTGDPGIATADVDYMSDSGTVTFDPGETTKSVTLTVNGDTIAEPPLLFGEWALVQFSDPSANATVDRSFYGIGIAVIVDDD